ncbi:alternate-type signal peptide domain-containing protein [Arthrobacter sp. ISL-30]|uniref:alternate-type signal peptide domain-containing protein n=1 Tax=Arthrobacter sp. ISL-30 TaxID=2819109 RepID=UPI001BE99AEF|nr:alternate-type signal peptide domain-containing protein [Arthrobacter sp. ISL-30]MBT2515263.1 alternate-type signal peptide domain-containing protein [Arthrobacter sp. ISL-30]
MKNATLIKGAGAIAVGAGLLLGGGGTLAWWNAADSAAPGTIVAGDLNVAKAGAGVWTDRAGNTIDVASYKVVPGDKLTFTQTLTVTLTGDKMAAELTATGTGASSGFTAGNVAVTTPVLTSGGTVITNPLTTSKTVTATITFEFKSSATGRADTTASYDLGNVAFTLTQIQQPGLA